jgi:hypothetical protein
VNLYYNGTDIYNDVAVNYCVHEMFAEKQADTLVIRFNDANGVWSKWNPAEGDEIRLKDEAADTGKMFIHFMRPENGLYTIRAMSMPKSGATKKSKSWEGVRFLQLANEIAGNHGLTFQNYGCEDQVYPYLKQERETDFALFSRICTLEGCQMLIYDGKLLAYNEQYIESQPVAGSLSVGENGNFEYHDNRGDCYGSCEVNSGSYSGKFSAPGSTSSTILRPENIQATSNAEAARFAKGLLRNANKYGQTGKFTKELLRGYAAASLLQLSTEKASAWNGPVFIYKARHDYVGNESTLYFRDLVEGY